MPALAPVMPRQMLPAADHDRDLDAEVLAHLDDLRRELLDHHGRRCRSPARRRTPRRRASAGRAANAAWARSSPDDRQCEPHDGRATERVPHRLLLVRDHLLLEQHLPR